MAARRGVTCGEGLCLPSPARLRQGERPFADPRRTSSCLPWESCKGGLGHRDWTLTRSPEEAGGACGVLQVCRCSAATDLQSRLKTAKEKLHY